MPLTLPLDHSTAIDLNRLAANAGWYVDLLKAVSFVFAPTSFRVVAIVLAFALAYRRRFRPAVWLAFTVLVGGFLNNAIKHLANRARPVVPHPVAHAAGSSFPSGHAFGAIVGVGALLLIGWPMLASRRRRPVAAAGILIVLAVGYSRLGLGVHFLSDVLGGYLLGLAWLGGCFAAFRPRGSARVAP